MKPSPNNIQEIYLESLKRLGVDPRLSRHPVRRRQLGTSGSRRVGARLGSMAGRDGSDPVHLFPAGRRSRNESGSGPRSRTALERLASYIQDKENVFELEWVDGVTYGDVFLQPEYEHSKYTFEVSDTPMLFNLLNQYEAEAKRALEQNLVFPAYDYALKCSHTFNLLDARGAISVTERTGYIMRVRNLARQCAATSTWRNGERLGFPLLKKEVTPNG